MMAENKCMGYAPHEESADNDIDAKDSATRAALRRVEPVNNVLTQFEKPLMVSKETYSLELIEMSSIDSSEHPYALISPEGHIYLVEYMGHNGMARRILETMYPNETIGFNELAETHLLNMGWLRTGRSYFRGDGDRWVYVVTTEPNALLLITDAQMEAVERYLPGAIDLLLDDIEGEKWRKRMRGGSE